MSDTPVASEAVPVARIPFGKQAREAGRIFRMALHKKGDPWLARLVGILLVVGAMAASGVYGFLKADRVDWSPAWVAAGLGVAALYDGFAKIVEGSAVAEVDFDDAALVSLKRMRWFLALCAFAFSFGVAAHQLPWLIPGALLGMCAFLVGSSSWIAAGVSLRRAAQGD